MKNTRTRGAALCLALLLALAGCHAKEPGQTAKPAKPAEGAAITAEDLPENTGATETLEYVYRRVEAFLPEDADDTDMIGGARYDAETGILRCVINAYEEGDWTARYAEIQNDGTVLVEIPLGMPEGYRAFFSVMEDGAVCWLADAYDPETEEEHMMFCRLRIGDDMVEAGDDFAGSMKRNWADYVNTLDLEEDADGNLYLLTEDELAVFGPDFTMRAKGKGAGDSGELLSAPDGVVWIKSPKNGRIGVAPLDAEGKAGDRRMLPASFNSPQVEAFHFLPDGAIVFQDSAGIWLWREGEEEPVFVMDWMNSDCVARNCTLFTAADGETFVIRDYDYDRPTDIALWRKADATDLAAVTVLEFCTTIDLPSYIPTFIVRFNREHPGVRIAVRDYYREYGYEEAGPKLVQDILTGIYRPDVVLGRTNGADLVWMNEHRTYLDLSPFLDADDTVNRENVFGCVQRALATGEGGMWAIPDEFYVNTLVAPASVLPEGGWTLAEMLDFFESLPEDVIRMEGLTRENAASRLLGKNSYGVFFDREAGLCSFDDPLYLRWLDFLLSLPANEAELRKSSEFEQIAQSKDGEKYQYYWGGKVALSRMTVRRFSSILSPTFTFGSRDWSFVGFPTSDGHIGTETVCEKVFVVMNWAEEADAAWDLIRAVVSDGDSIHSGDHHRMMMPILKSQLASDLATAEDYVYTFKFSGGSGMTSKALYDHPPTDADLRQPGKLLEYLPEEDGARLLDFLDGIAGEAVASGLPDEVQAIVDEEMSVLLGGVGTTARCAEKIQSRASIWLAEHQ